MSNKESEDTKTEITEKPAASETLTSVFTPTTKDKSFLGLNFNDPWTLGATTLIATSVGATLAYFLSPAIRQWVDNIRQTAAIPQPPPPVATAPTNLSPTAEELEKKYYADKIKQQQQQEQQFYESFRPATAKKKRMPESSNYYDQYENDIPIIDDNDIFSKVSKRKYQDESFFKVRDEELHPFHQKEEKKQQAEKPPMFAESKKIPEEELSIYTDDKIDIDKLPPEFVNVENREQTTKDNDDYDITNLEMTEEELNNLAKNNSSG